MKFVSSSYKGLDYECFWRGSGIQNFPIKQGIYYRTLVNFEKLGKKLTNYYKCRAVQVMSYLYSSISLSWISTLYLSWEERVNLFKQMIEASQLQGL